MEPDTQSAATSPAPRRDDLLADARCLKCGYSLRGLSENRCPECGTAFDPATCTSAFLPKWPDLMAWYLGGYVAHLLLRIGAWLIILQSAIASRPPGPPRIIFGRHNFELRLVLELLIVPTLAALAIVGLHRRRDWGRKACIILQALRVFTWIAVWVVAEGGYPRTPIAGLFWYVKASGPDLLFAVVCPAVLIVSLLSTGLRRRSLARTGGQQLTTLPLADHRPRSDWPLTLSVLLIATAAGHLYVPADIFHAAFIIHGLGRWPAWLCEPAAWVDLSGGLGLFICYILAAVLILRRPDWAKRSLYVLLGLTIAVMSLFTVLNILEVSAAPNARLYRGLAKPTVGLVSSVLPTCAMLIFLRRKVDAAAIRITTLDTRGSPGIE
ncbi:MAG: hypothetical protein QUV05_08280 [Phycisphaerae bacterium]|nr:hypothetical protein [Phycisphaerae bacterium]